MHSRITMQATRGMRTSQPTNGDGTPRKDRPARQPRGPARPTAGDPSTERPSVTRDEVAGPLAPTVYLPRDLRNPEPLDRLHPDAESGD